MTDPAVLAAARQFGPADGELWVQPCGSGNVNETYVVRSAAAPFILQRLNTRVFPAPRLIMHNLKVLTAHVARRQVELQPPPGRRWEIPRIIPTCGGEDFWIDGHGSFWRALTCITGAQTADAIGNESHAWEVGYALGRFHRLVSDLPPHSLADTLPDFHVTPVYLRAYEAILEQQTLPDEPEVVFARAFISRRRTGVAVLEEARRAGILTLRTIHGDPKVNNVLLAEATGQAVGLIDLDTVKPGLVHYDLGDCLRSGCNPQGEETTDWQQVHFHLPWCRAILAGYFSQAQDFLSGADYDYLFEGIRLIAFELGLRFFTDYLAGNVYFRVREPAHNLRRALVQFKLTESIEAQEADIRRLLQEWR